MSTFTPVNPLEESLLATQKGELEPVAFFNQLMAAQVLVLLDRPLATSGEWDNSINPLILNAPGGFPALALFTSSERAAAISGSVPPFQVELEVQTSWILRGAQGQIGLVLNPGSAFGFELPPDGLNELKQAYGIGAAEVAQ